MGSCFSTDHITEYHTHTDITCHIEEPDQKYRLVTNAEIMASQYIVSAATGYNIEYACNEQLTKPLFFVKLPFSRSMITIATASKKKKKKKNKNEAKHCS